MIFVTGAAGFIGANFVHHWLGSTDEPLLVLDVLTYAGNLESLGELRQDPRFGFARVDICDRAAVAELLQRHRPRALLHFAAESHVDRSIGGPDAFVRTNIVGTFELLEAVRGWRAGLDAEAAAAFRFLHVSTDEVYGSLGDEGMFTEATPYAPNSPYSASKAASDHLVRAFHHTYGLPVLTTNCSNNYGPFQFPEKVIPLFVTNALDDAALPLYAST
ncbi:MAG: GDP-mannose 4,6-dehydratase, partial [Betaproteobacteria bacterium]|nr:GDP-mannose 4,6-dehydratase [Betaproteobacteria bacterium]